MPICAICGEEEEQITKCGRCGEKYCAECGDSKTRLCYYCGEDDEDVDDEDDDSYNDDFDTVTEYH